MNSQLIGLNNKLADTTSLNALYEAKREELELDYKNQKFVLEKQIRGLEKHLEILKADLNRLEKQIETKTTDLKKIVAETKEATFWNKFKKTWVDQWSIFALVGFLGLIIGGIFGWGIFTLIGNIFSSIGEFFGSIFQ